MIKDVSHTWEGVSAAHVSTKDGYVVVHLFEHPYRKFTTSIYKADKAGVALSSEPLEQFVGNVFNEKIKELEFKPRKKKITKAAARKAVKVVKAKQISETETLTELTETQPMTAETKVDFDLSDYPGNVLKKYAGTKVNPEYYNKIHIEGKKQESEDKTKK